MAAARAIGRQEGQTPLYRVLMVQEHTEQTVRLCSCKKLAGTAPELRPRQWASRWRRMEATLHHPSELGSALGHPGTGQKTRALLGAGWLWVTGMW